MIAVVDLAGILVASIFLALSVCYMLYKILGNMPLVIRVLDVVYQFAVASVFAQEILLAYALDLVGCAPDINTPILLVFRHASYGWMYVVS